jgi:hypothetical protein
VDGDAGTIVSHTQIDPGILLERKGKALLAIWSSGQISSDRSALVRTSKCESFPETARLRNASTEVSGSQKWRAMLKSQRTNT